MRPSLGVFISVAVFCSVAGCAGTHSARYVYQDGTFGVIGIPENTDRWPTRYRRQAEKLMDAQFPEGHEIVRAEEVVEGSRTLTLQGTKTAELTPEVPTSLLQIGKLGRHTSRSQADTVKITECRIVYRRTPHADPPAAYTEVASLTPSQYVDPNVLERRKVSAEEANKEKPTEKTAEGKKEEPSESASVAGKIEVPEGVASVSRALRPRKGRALDQ